MSNFTNKSLLALGGDQFSFLFLEILNNEQYNVLFEAITFNFLFLREIKEALNLKIRMIKCRLL